MSRAFSIRRTLSIRRVRAACSVAAALTLVALLAPPASAQVVRAYTTRFSVNAAGDISLLGNTLMSCTGGNSCMRARNGQGNALNNNDWDMDYVDVDTDNATFNSSTSNLTLPVGATVMWAGLYWGGLSNNASRNTVRFRTPAAGYRTVTASRIDVATTNAYGCFADVTTDVQAGVGGTYGAANVQSDTGTNGFAGWSLVVVYGLSSLPSRNLVVLDGFAQVEPNTSLTLTLSGFVTPPAGAVQTRVGVVALEGDLDYDGDFFRLNGTNLTDSQNPSTNFFNSSVSALGAQFTAKNPNYLNQLGYDTDLFNANGILPNGATSATLLLSTTDDRYYPTAVTFATDLYAPVIEGNAFQKSVTDVNGAPARPGDVLEYTLRMKNTGQDNSVQSVLRDTLPANLDYVAGTLTIVNGPNAGAKTDGAGDDQAEYVAASRSVVVRLGTGANASTGGTIAPGVQTIVRFRASVHVPTASGSIVANQAGLAFLAAQLGTAFKTRSDADTVAAGFQPTSTTVTAVKIIGRVFEDPNYGGGAGRTYAASSGTARPSVRLELYNSAGAYADATTTDASGNYAFDGWTAGNYTVRVSSSTVTSGRTGSIAGLLPVQTFRTNASTGTAVADAARVGGEEPAKADAASNATAQTLAALTTATTIAQSVAPVTLGASDVTGVDFGFNFSTVVNVNDAGQGSLRQFIVNNNALANTGLAQVGQTAGVEAALFMLPDGLTHAGLRAGITNQLTLGVARILALTALPAITGASTRIDGALQTASVGNTNAGSLGAGGTVGVDGLALATVAAPEIEIVDGASVTLGLDVQAASVTIASLAVSGFGNVAEHDGNADVRVGAGASGAIVQSCVLGATARAFGDPGAAARSGGDHVRAIGAATGTVTSCLVGFGGGDGIALTGGANGWTVTGNELRENGQTSPTGDGLTIVAGGSATARGNLIVGNGGSGLDARTSSGSNTIENNTVTGNGVAASGTAETPGVRLGGASNLVDRNVVNANYGAGVLAISVASANRLTRNSIYLDGTIVNRAGTAATGQLGIDLLATGQDEARGTSPFLTKNDTNDSDAGANGLLNFPVLSSVAVSAGTVTITGWARPGSTIELFVADRDASGFGEGKTYLTSLLEGSASDLDATTSAYAPPVNGLDQGSDNTNRFRFVIPTPAGMPASGDLTATATIAASGTSEFSGCVSIAGGVVVSGFAYDDRDHDAARDAAEPGTGAVLYVKLVPEPLPALAIQTAAVDPTTGAYAFSAVVPGTYTLVLDDNAIAADVTPTMPAGWLATQAAPGVHPGVVVAAIDVSGQNFGLWHGSTVGGTVFRDDGAAGAAGNTANDGVKQAGEPGVSGVELGLVASFCAGSGGGCDSTVTDGAGAYRLWLPFGAPGSNAEVRERNAAGWVSTGGAAGTTGGSYSRVPDRVAFSASAGQAYTGVSFGDVSPNVFAPGGASSVAPGAAAAYAHRFMAASAGAVTFSAAQLASPPLVGWSIVLYRDANCNGVLDVGESPVSGSSALVSGQSVCLIARHASPAGAPAGANEQATLTATFTYSNASPALTAPLGLADVTTVLAAGGGLAIVKSVNRATAVPGDVLTYTITYTNLAPTPLTSIAIQDATPSFTVFVGGSCGTLGAGLSSCALTTAPAAGATGSLAWTLIGALAPGASGSVSFQVRVQ